MGLDMYLDKEMYVGANWCRPEKISGEVTLKVGNVDFSKRINPFKISRIVEMVGYWRKANQIHRWFVENVQDGEDDCGRYPVSGEQLAELLRIVKIVIANPDLAKELLPTKEGFFFGDTEYGDYYIEDLQNTVEILEGLDLSDNIEDTYYYHSSW